MATSKTLKTINQKSNIEMLLDLVKEFELSYNLSPKLSKSGKNKIKTKLLEIAQQLN